MTKTRCAFCGQPNKISNEHIWGQWIGPLVGVGQVSLIDTLVGDNDPERISVVHRLTQDDGEATSFAARTLSHRVKAPCEPCNNGWMSNLETGVQPILSPMIRDGARAMLNAQQQTMIATWATKTAMMCEFLHGGAGRRYFTAAELRFVMDNLRPPEDVHVWIAHCRAPHVCDGRSLNWGVNALDGESVKASLTTHAIGHFAFQVFSYRRAIAKTDLMSFRNGPWDRTLTAIWPVENPSLQWPSPLSITGHLWRTFCDRIIGIAYPSTPLP